ncbi:DNA-binding transcriptional regulator, LysR family [Paenibacillus sp. UNC496MF]|uniref:LysR family transcriptional regulator n=1 Tax=Paenibacillus sp. UNC496MF TaxID=1502753 RepID=UPI0008F2BFC0|nr:LysR family transcriptional regulator [Paenibacillus sp. UNC496MF]SFJ23523.1 DNA-binding transcriptional regulator, LysR family [Paenibacillus sp. UNC496MF]
MDIQHFLTFREVAKWQNYTKAADQLGYAQSSVTTQIQKLEQEYGVVLFERFGRRMRPTQSGEQLLLYANQIADLFQESKSVVGRQECGALGIASIETMAAFLLPRYLHRFRGMYPQVQVLLEPAQEERVKQAVRDGEADMGILLDVPLADPELDSIVIRKEEMVVAASADHPFAKLKAVEWRQLSGESFIMTEQDCTYRAALERELRTRQIPYRLAYELGSMEAIKQCVVYGLGIALIPRIAIQSELEKEQLCTVPLCMEDLSFYTQLIYRKRKYMTTPMKHLIELLTEGHEAQTV